MLYTIFIKFAVEHSIVSKGIHLYPLLDQPSILFSDHPLSENPHSLWVRITKNFDWFFQPFWKWFPTSEFLDFGRLFTKWQKKGAGTNSAQDKFLASIFTWQNQIQNCSLNPKEHSNFWFPQNIKDDKKTWNLNEDRSAFSNHNLTDWLQKVSKQS